ncbi:hypothetical protein KY289_020696 [Solanum tuberosum]|nr:hypothetical protein KY289_020696 [Solanum tuberosum]
MDPYELPKSYEASFKALQGTTTPMIAQYPHNQATSSRAIVPYQGPSSQQRHCSLSIYQYKNTGLLFLDLGFPSNQTPPMNPSKKGIYVTATKLIFLASNANLRHFMLLLGKERTKKKLRCRSFMRRVKSVVRRLKTLRTRNLQKKRKLPLIILIDSGSTHSFVSPQVVKALRLYGPDRCVFPGCTKY